LACEVFKSCNESNPLIAQDLLICEIDLFYKHTILELAITSESYEFVCLVPVQQLLTDVWYDKISPHVSGWQVCIRFD
jgi:hypothetical protein